MLPMFLSAPRSKTAATAIAAVAASVVFAGTGSQADASGCAPEAYTPGVAGGWGIALANLPCSGTYEIRLVNNVGNVIRKDTGTASGGVQTSNTVCAGAIVHTFITVNVGGTNMSDTSGTVPC